jgi:hypothetical protein
MGTPRVLLLTAVLGASGAFGACSAVSGVGRVVGISGANELSFGQVQTIQPGLSAAAIRDSFGPPVNTSRSPEGRVVRMEYAALDAKKSRARLILDFDASERLVTKTYTGEILRP